MANNITPTSLRLGRLESESLLLASRLGKVNYDRVDGTWVHIEQFHLPAGWNRRTVELLIDIPHSNPGYPSVAPQWFWTDRDLRTSEGLSIGHFFTGGSQADPEYTKRNWGHFCIHINQWRPAGGNLRSGHTLLNYIALIGMVFNDRRTLAQ